jgi:Domain of unknown function (DUF4188)
MAQVLPGRYAGSAPDGIVVFLIGMRVNRPLKLARWLPPFIAMPRMLRHLEAQPDAGLLSWHPGLMHGGPAIVQYWRSFEHLDRFARDPAAPHLPAWKQFNKIVRASGDVGIWHETYRAGPGDCEAIYSNMPRVGLGLHGDHRPIGSTSQTAPLRIGAVEADEPPVAPY